MDTRCADTAVRPNRASAIAPTGTSKVENAASLTTQPCSSRSPCIMSHDCKAMFAPSELTGHASEIR